MYCPVKGPILSATLLKFSSVHTAICCWRREQKHSTTHSQIPENQQWFWFQQKRELFTVQLQPINPYPIIVTVLFYCKVLPKLDYSTRFLEMKSTNEFKVTFIKDYLILKKVGTTIGTVSYDSFGMYLPTYLINRYCIKNNWVIRTSCGWKLKKWTLVYHYQVN